MRKAYASLAILVGLAVSCGSDPPSTPPADDGYTMVLVARTTGAADGMEFSLELYEVLQRGVRRSISAVSVATNLGETPVWIRHSDPCCGSSIGILRDGMPACPRVILCPCPGGEGTSTVLMTGGMSTEVNPCPYDYRAELDLIEIRAGFSYRFDESGDWRTYTLEMFPGEVGAGDSR